MVHGEFSSLKYYRKVRPSKNAYKVGVNAKSDLPRQMASAADLKYESKI
jgi:hypothetical protein